jgi:hypothetical protein
MTTDRLRRELVGFKDFGTATQCSELALGGVLVPMYLNEFWTAKQRAAVSLHEVPYRACFKPQLPRFFIERFTRPGELVYDPFMGRGTTLLEAALLGRHVAGCDVNPLSACLVAPRLMPPTQSEVKQRLQQIDFSSHYEPTDDLLVFYHPDTLRQICSLRAYLIQREASGTLDAADAWIRMVALTRLTGHSTGYFSVYTLPPNQATYPDAQRKINAKRNQSPEPRDVGKIILKKSDMLLKELGPADFKTLRAAKSQVITGPSDATTRLASNSVALVVTSPPFLSVVDYNGDNWLRCWFIGVDAKQVPITILKKVSDWQAAMTKVFKELHRVLRPGGHIAFEVGEVNAGKVKLEEAALPCGLAAGLQPELILINAQEFTKTANCWGVDNNNKGTNTNRILLFHKDA